MTDQVSINQEPLYGCASCTGAWNAGDLRVYESKCWCEGCWEEKATVEGKDCRWNDLPQFMPAKPAPFGVLEGWVCAHSRRRDQIFLGPETTKEDLEVFAAGRWQCKPVYSAQPAHAVDELLKALGSALEGCTDLLHSLDAGQGTQTEMGKRLLSARDVYDRLRAQPAPALAVDEHELKARGAMDIRHLTQGEDWEDPDLRDLIDDYVSGLRDRRVSSPAVDESPGSVFEILMRDITEMPEEDIDINERAICIDYDWLYGRVKEAFGAISSGATQPAPATAIGEGIPQTVVVETIESLQEAYQEDSALGFLLDATNLIRSAYGFRGRLAQEQGGGGDAN